MTFKHFKLIILALAIVAFTAGCSPKKAEKPSPLIGPAKTAAVEAAQALVNTDHADTLAMQNAILASRVAMNEFLVAEDTAAVNTFFRSFKQHLVENDPDLAKQIFVERPKNLPPDEPWDEFEQLVEDPMPQE